MPRLHFFSLPFQATKTTYTIFSFPNEILHKLTSCHFILQNKTLNDLYKKKYFSFHLPEQNCTIHQGTVTQTHDLSCHQFSLKKPVLTQLLSKRNILFFASFKTSNITFQISFLKNKQEMMSTNERRRETT